MSVQYCDPGVIFRCSTCVDMSPSCSIDCMPSASNPAQMVLKRYGNIFPGHQISSLNPCRSPAGNNGRRIAGLYMRISVRGSTSVHNQSRDTSSTRQMMLRHQALASLTHEPARNGPSSVDPRRRTQARLPTLGGERWLSHGFYPWHARRVPCELNNECCVREEGDQADHHVTSGLWRLDQE